MIKRLSLALLIFVLTVLINPLTSYSQTSSSQDYRLQQIDKLSATASSQVATSSAKASKSITFLEGSITSISGSTIFLSTNTGTKMVYTSDSTKFLNLDSSGKKLIGISDLRSGDNLEVIGPSPQTNSGSAKIIVRDQTNQIKNFGLFGQVSEINPTTLKLSNFTRSDLPVLQITLNSDTTFVEANNQNLKLADITAKNLVVVAGYFNDKNNLITTQVFRTKITTNTLKSTSSVK